MAIEDRIRLPALNLIHRRSRLLDKLAGFVEAKQRLITIYAPGGYGKSILLADFAQTTDFPVCWCSLEPPDRDPTSFLTLLSHSIIDRFHDINPDDLLRLVARGDTQASIRRIAEQLTKVGPHIIIVDDYHKAISAGMTLALNRLLDQLPETSTMIVAARGDMSLETGQILDLLITEQATGLSEEELRFTPRELQRVMLKRFGRQIDLESAEEIARATDGNIAQILLTGHITHAGRMIGKLVQRVGDDREIIYDYLAREVFGKQPPALQQFMTHTSVLPEMTVELCNALLDISDAQGYLETLLHNDLFITQKGTGFRYHDLFAEFLRARLQEDETAYRQTCIKAGNLLADRARYEDAINLYLSVQAWDEAASLLERQGKFFYDTGRALTLDTWLAEISEEELAQYPRLLLLRGRILNVDLGNLNQAMNYYKRAEEVFFSQGDSIGTAEAQLWKSVALRMMGRAKEGLALATSALDQLEGLNADKNIIAYAIRNRGMAYWTAGNVAEALPDFRRALQLFEALDDTFSIGMCHQEIGICLEKQGNISGAGHHFKQALHIWETLGNANDLANTLNSLGVSLYAIGHYEEALKYFSDSLDVALQVGATRRAAFAQTGIGDAYLGLRKYKQATEAYSRSTEFAQQASVRSLEIYNLIKFGECYFQQHNLTQALTLASQAKEIATEIGLTFEKGLACTLQAKIFVQREEYEASFELFAEALKCVIQSDVLEQAKLHLWWGYSLLLDLRTTAAFEQLQEVTKLALEMGELLPGLGPTVAETQPLLLHFLHRVEIPTGVRDNIQYLLRQSTEQSHDGIELSKPGLQIFSFGTPYLTVAGRRRLFSQRGRIRKAPEFLLYLLLEGEDNGCRWDEVSAAIWPELDADKASVTFHQTLRRLRNTLFDTPEDYIIVQDDYYQVNPGYLEWCDALAFQQLYERATRLPPEEALPLHLELIALYRGEYLDGFELEEWGTSLRSSFETKFLQVVKLAGEQLLKAGSAREALNIINQGLAFDYFREDLHRAAFKAYVQLGLYEHLTIHYAELQATFEREFDAPPDQVTAQLYGQLMSHR